MTATPARFSTQNNTLTHTDFRIRRSSTPANSSRGVDMSRGQDSLSSADLVSVSGYDTDPFATHPDSLSSFTSVENNARGKSDPHPTVPKKRGSLLLAASDVLSFKFGRRRKSIQRPPMPVILPDVIEISAPRRDEEDEERERLRDAAAQSIGLDPVLMSRDDSPKEKAEREASVEDSEDTPGPSESVHLPTRSLHEGAATEPITHTFDFRRSSHRTHSRSNSYSNSYSPPIPAFPCAPSSLAEFQQMSSTLPKYYPPTSLRLFSLSKHWKTRFLILSSPAFYTSRGPAVSYLHLFKSSALEEKELERLEINEDSVVFVAEEEVGSRRSVVKVRGVDVGPLKRDFNQEQGGNSMWFLQIVDPLEAQKWIAAIKNAILGQRSLRAGLGIPVNTLGRVEPRGDMDVMLTMRAHQIVTSPTQPKSPLANFNRSRSLPLSGPHPFASPDQNYAPSISSNSSRSRLPSPKTPISVSTLKGLFIGVGRPRSPSRSDSIDEGPEPEPNEDSFGRVGNNLLSMMRTNGVSDIPPLSPFLASSPQSYPTTPTGGFPSTGVLSDQRLGRRIFTDHRSGRLLTGELSSKSTRSLPMVSLSLPPAPPKRSWAAGTPSSTPNHSAMYTHGGGNGSVAGNFGIGGQQPPSTPPLTGQPFGPPEHKARASSLHSVSTLASGEAGSHQDRSNSSTKTKRWSRQGSLPQRSTPPSGPLPSAPTSPPSRAQNEHPYSPEAGNAWQSSSSIRSAASQVSVVSSLPNFSKRGSNSSGTSVGNNSSQPYANGHQASNSTSHRMSVPPPRPIPTFAPPPTPDHDDVAKPPKSAPVTKTSLRDSAHRAFRLSLNGPKPPPTTILPPRPDDPEFHGQGKSSSNPQSSDLYSIPGSPTPAASPLPSPKYPPPPRPSSPTSTTRNTSIKQRLRILSAPPQPATKSASESAAPSTRPLTSSMVDSPLAVGYSPPATPIGERITHLQNDPSFLQLHSPNTPTMSDTKPQRQPPPPGPGPNSGVPELTSLPPPPRRGSKQLSAVATRVGGLQEVQPVVQGEEKLISLSQQGSVISLGIVSM